jgi:hypothetical protein
MFTEGIDEFIARSAWNLSLARLGTLSESERSNNRYGYAVQEFHGCTPLFQGAGPEPTKRPEPADYERRHPRTVRFAAGGPSVMAANLGSKSYAAMTVEVPELALTVRPRRINAEASGQFFLRRRRVLKRTQYHFPGSGTLASKFSEITSTPGRWVDPTRSVP